MVTHNINAGYNHFFQNAFVKATGLKGLRYGKASLGIARKMGKRAHTTFHKRFDNHLNSIGMKPSSTRSSRAIVAEMNLDFEGVVSKFSPFFDLPENRKWKSLFDDEVAALRAGKRTVQ